jgi:predicted GH43/DUF377 family glycosyl hydrolase
MNDRVIIRPFIPGNPTQIEAIIARVLEMSEPTVVRELAIVRQEFDFRHFEIESVLLAHYRKVLPHVLTDEPVSLDRQLLIGALFSGEYALESAALFNPSIVAHPDQSDVPVGAVRFVMSLRATGEGHISSIEFRTGLIFVDSTIHIDPISRFVTAPERIPDPDSESNYALLFSERLAISERIIFPSSPAESNGIEDARFVRFIRPDGEAIYYATYTAYNGHVTLPQLIETSDFRCFKIITLTGGAVQNKGMAMFPRLINGRYAMLSRQDDENLFVMFSDSPYHWSNPQIILRPKQLWEYVKIGNCGSPIETPEGWLVITHGVGPMRKYCIGAVLLDLDDPTKVLGRLRTPLLSPEVNEREGYVPNVVYSCGSMIHDDHLIIPYAMSDAVSAIATVSLTELLSTLLGRTLFEDGSTHVTTL